MSEFPEWVEQSGLGDCSYEESLELHRKLKVVYELIPDIDQRMDTPLATPLRSFLARLLGVK